MFISGKEILALVVLMLVVLVAIVFHERVQLYQAPISDLLKAKFLFADTAVLPIYSKALLEASKELSVIITARDKQSEKGHFQIHGLPV